MKKVFLYLWLGVLFVFPGCSNLHPKNIITQTSTIDSLLAGVYDGHMSCDELLKYGDFGIGTFDHLDGEMIILDREIYQVKADGKVYRPDRSITTPFASVCNFSTDETINFKSGISFQDVQKILDEQIPNQNLFYAIKIQGTFTRMHTRSVPLQAKPYPPLAEVTKNQPEFRMKNVSGTIVGFRCPPFVKGINVPGYHFHFISDDREYGGHILNFEMGEGKGELDRSNKFTLILPEKGDAFSQVDLSRDRSRDLEQVER